MWDVWGPIAFGTPRAWAIIGVFAAVELAFLRLLPGREFRGPTTPEGQVPVYRANGPLAFALSVALFVGASFGLGAFSPALVYDEFGPILAALNLFSLAFCAGLFVKARVAPTGPDRVGGGNPVADFYWGRELHPRVLGWDVKAFTNARFGMMGWALIVISFAAAQRERHGALGDAMAVAVAVQLLYIAKFFWWETGYFGTLDMMHDRAGFYLCWGCLVWVSAVYTASTLYLVDHPNHLGTPMAAGLLAAGAGCVLANYLCDRQRQRFRAAGGRVRVWGREPLVVVARSTTASGEPRESLLLASGWWGLARHFHYVPEIGAAFFWTVPAGFGHPLPYFYVAFLTVLLVHRSRRDDRRCAAKYGRDWERYCELVPYRIVPGVY